jgi:aspartate aminotransferase-like enzyme
MEMALVNVATPGERVLVISQGYFGDRWGDLAASFGIEAEVLRAQWGEAVPPEQVARELAGGRFRAVMITHVDTSTGTQAPAAEYCRLLAGRDELVILDGVCATGGIDEPCDAWGVDVLLTAPQKAIGAPPGVAMCLFSPLALARRRELARVPAYYADVLRWLPIMEDPGRYYSTPCVNEIFALAEALRIVHEEGLETRFARHARLGAACRAGLEALGLPTFTAPDCRAATLSVMRLPAGVDDAAFGARRTGAASPPAAWADRRHRVPGRPHGQYRHPRSRRPSRPSRRAWRRSALRRARALAAAAPLLAGEGA